MNSSKICDIGGSGIRIKSYSKRNNVISQRKREQNIEIEFDKYIKDVNPKKREITVEINSENRAIMRRLKNIKNCYIGATGGLRKKLLELNKNCVFDKDYKVYSDGKELFKIHIFSGDKEGIYEFQAAKYKLKKIEGLLSMGSTSVQIVFSKDRKREVKSIDIGFKYAFNKKCFRPFTNLKNKTVCGISSAYWAAKGVDKISKLFINDYKNIIDDENGVLVNKQFVDNLDTICINLQKLITKSEIGKWKNIPKTDKKCEKIPIKIENMTDNEITLSSSKYPEKDNVELEFKTFMQIHLLNRICNYIKGKSTKIIFKREWSIGKLRKFYINWPMGKILEILK